MRKIKFKNFIEKAEFICSFPECDFIDDVRSDKSFRDFKNWDELENYLMFNNACDGALKAANSLWSYYEEYYS
jgi:hypothetical protein